MTFQDRFPTQIEFEINRPALKRLYQIQGLLISSVFPLLLAFVFSLGCIGDFSRMHAQADWQYKFGWGVIIVLGCLLAGLLLGLIIYFSYFHHAAELHAKNLRLLVEGPYLRMISGGYTVIDRRFHFRDVHTYCTVEDPTLRYVGLKTLTFCTDQRPAHRVDGLSNANEVRDLLCEIDAARTEHC